MGGTSTRFIFHLHPNAKLDTNQTRGKDFIEEWEENKKELELFVFS